MTIASEKKAGFDFVAIDFETANYDSASAVSIGLIKYVDGAEVDSLYSLIKPPVLYIRPDFTQIHGLTVADVRDAPSFDAIWGDVFAFIDGYCLIAHNAGFDMKVLKSVLEHYLIKIPALYSACSLKMARKLWKKPQVESRALTALAEHFGIIYDAHNALDDARTCAKIVMLAANECEAANLKQLLHKTAQKKIRV
ncbi:MAG: hypothetical protein Ta2A_17380 [Treponemataceae bacterium]|nr:MAG: hypothetical protein Ta2A_17380 [Treponemataceae bacterium]